MAWGLIIWSGAATLWWFIAVWLVSSRKSPPATATAVSAAKLSIFKSLPENTTLAERTALAGALRSFHAQLGAGDEMLLGVPESEAAHWQPRFDDWQQREPAKLIRVCSQSAPRQRANPKVAWLEVLAPLANGELWLWSDADIVASPNLLDQLRQALPTTRAGAVTCAYCVRRAASPAAVLDAAFVNAEFLPGALLLGRLGAVDFAFGAATLFRAADFQKKVSWETLGASLADDYALGQQLKPVALTGPMVETLALETTLIGALRHYYRWQKTIRWCRPGSYAALLAILPLLGWGVLAAVQPANALAWLGLGLQWGIEVAAVVALCLVLGCRMSIGAWAALALWPPVHALTWLAVWLPLAVFWRGAQRPWLRPTA